MFDALKNLGNLGDLMKRAQEMKGKGFSPHFKIGCMVSAGRDQGDHLWECQAL